MDARYEGLNLSRFLSEDPILITPTTDQKALQVFLSNPQKWNTYSYVENNPLTSTDPTGLYTTQQNAAIANVFAAFGISSPTAAQSAAIRNLAYSFGVNPLLITGLDGGSSGSVSQSTPTILFPGQTISRAPSQYQQYSNGVMYALNHPFDVLRIFPYTSPAQKTGIGVALFGETASLGGGGGEYRAAETGISETAAKIAAHAATRPGRLEELGAKSESDLAKIVEDVMSNPDRVMLAPNDRAAALYKEGGINLVLDMTSNNPGKIFSTANEMEKVW